MHKSRSMDQKIRIFESAATEMIKSGSLNITMDNIAAGLKGTKGTLYYYFKSKGELFYAMQKHAYDLMEGAVYKAMEANAHLPALEKAELFLKTHCKVFLDNLDLWYALWTDIAFQESPPQYKRVLTRRRRKYEETLQLIIEQIAAEKGIGIQEPKLSAMMILAMLNSIPRWYRKTSKGISPEQMAELATKRALYGLFEIR